MAEENGAGEKKHEATGKRLADLRRKGSVLRSRDFSGTMVYVGTLLVVVFLADGLRDRFAGNFFLVFNNLHEVASHEEVMFHLMVTIVTKTFFLLLPIFAIAVGMTLFTPFLMGGWNFTLEALDFNWGKLDLIAGLKRLFSPVKAAIEVSKSVLKAGLLIATLIYFVYANRLEISNLANYQTIAAILSGYQIIYNFIVLLTVSVVILTAVDVAYQIHHFYTENKMTSQELRDEHKDTEGDDRIKRKIRIAQLNLLKQRIMQSVPKSHVIITNPTHYAIALRYEPGKDQAPKLVAKGKDHLAHQIRMLAIAHGVPIYEAPALARAVYYTTKIGFEIHPELYMAVAIVLSYVHQLKNYQRGIGEPPTRVDNLEIPEEFMYDE